MENILQKLSSYNLLNYLLSGVLFVFFVDEFTEYNLTQENTLIGLFLYYFIGLVISRIGAIFIAPIFKEILIFKFGEHKYSDFVEATKKDEKIEVLSEQNNMYRTLIALFLILSFSRIFIYFDNFIFITIIFLLVLFIFSYYRQNVFIIKRIKIFKK